MKKPLAGISDIIDDVVQNDSDWGHDRNERRGGRYDVEPINMLSTKLDALVTQLQRSNMLSSSSSTSHPPPKSPNAPMHAHNVSHVNSMPMDIMFCDLCGLYEHYVDQYYLIEPSSLLQCFSHLIYYLII